MNPNHVDVAVAERVVARLFAGWRKAPNAMTVATAADLGPVVLKELAQQGEQTAKGVFHDGTFYLVAEQHSSEAEVEETVFHEVWGHYGLRSALVLPIACRVIESLPKID